MAALDVCSQVVTVKSVRIKKYAKLLLVNNRYDVGYAYTYVGYAYTSLRYTHRILHIYY